MITIGNTTAIRFLEREPLRYECELTALKANIPPIPRSLFADAAEPTCMMLVEEFPHGTSATICGYDESFLKDCAEWLQEKEAEFMLLALDERVLRSPHVAQWFTLDQPRCYRSFVCTSSERVSPTNVTAYKLTEADREAVARYPQEPEAHQHPLSAKFEMFVLKGAGDIYAIKDKDEIVAWLSCCRARDNIWDVDFIHVRHDRRRQGLGWQVAAMYARDKLAGGQIPFYSSARDEASERTALKAGFTCCRELWSATARQK